MSGQRAVSWLLGLAMTLGVVVACGQPAPAQPAAARPGAAQPSPAAGAPPQPAPARGEPYKVGITVALTGPVADSFAPAYEGLNIYLQRLNDQGGINGHPVQLLVEDDAGDATKATTNTTKLVQNERVHLMILSSLSATYGPVLHLTKQANTSLLIMSVCPREAFPPAEPHVFCSSSFGALYDSTFAMQFIRDAAREPVRLGLVALDVPVSRISIDHAERLMTEHGGQVVAKVVIPGNATDFTPFATQLQQAGANWVFAWAPWSTQIGPFEALQKLGWRGNYLLWAHQPAEEELARRRTDNLYALAGNALFVENLPAHQEIRQAAEKYKTTYPVEQMAEGWTAALVVEQALWGCGWPCDSATLQAVLSKLDVDMKGLRGGPLQFSADNHYRTKVYYKVYRWDPQQNRLVTVRDWGGLDVQ
jgi:ABC-type branched-subunit amino acid transport system substrate-binding protein